MGWAKKREKVHYQPLVIKGTFPICLQKFAFGLCLLILLTSDILHIVIIINWQADWTTDILHEQLVNIHTF